MMRARGSFRVREIGPDDWADLERLFGARGACGGCWCMHWRVEKGESWDDLKGENARARFRALVQSGKAHGLLAYDGDEPVGWAALDRKSDFSRLARSPSLRTDDAPDVWALPCFFVKAGHRGQGVASALLDGALDALRRRGGGTLEAYPLAGEGKLPAAFAWTGTVPMFERAGFERETDAARGKVRMRRRVG
jgi:GNAT superfamily N-acetyltransferase